jgi:hypothetical protein
MIETYASRARPSELETATARLRRLIDAAGSEDRPMRHVRSFFVADDETCFHVVEAPSIQDAAALSQLARIPAERIVEAEAGPAPVEPT